MKIEGRVITWITLYLVMLAGGAVAGGVDAGKLRVDQAYARETPPGVSSAAAYLTLINATDKKQRLISVSSDRAARVMIHQNRMQGDMMHMQHLSELEIMARSRFHFRPGGHHLMLSGLSEPLRAGEQLQLSLQFEDGLLLNVRLPVLAIDEPTDHKQNKLTTDDHFE